jgi:hypothetical protein
LDKKTASALLSKNSLIPNLLPLYNLHGASTQIREANQKGIMKTIKLELTLVVSDSKQFLNLTGGLERAFLLEIKKHVKELFDGEFSIQVTEVQNADDLS